MGEDKISFDIVKRLLLSSADRKTPSGVVENAKVAQSGGQKKFRGN